MGPRARAARLGLRHAGRGPLVQEYVHTCVDELNGRLNRWETIKDFRILDHDLSIEADELTPSMKVKRSVAEARHQRLIDEMYADPARR